MQPVLTPVLHTILKPLSLSQLRPLRASSPITIPDRDTNQHQHFPNFSNNHHAGNDPSPKPIRNHHLMRAIALPPPYLNGRPYAPVSASIASFSLFAVSSHSASGITRPVVWEF